MPSYARCQGTAGIFSEDQGRPLLIDPALSQLRPAEPAEVLEELAPGKNEKESLVDGLGLLAARAVEARGPERLELFLAGPGLVVSVAHGPILRDSARGARTGDG